MTPEQIDAVLADFRAWLEQLADAQQTAASEKVSEGCSAPAAPPDLHTLLGQFIALRHEINLQTRTSRGQQEQSAEALRLLNAALEALQRSQEAAAERDDAAQEETLRPLLKTMVDIYDALALARREIQRVRESVLPELVEMTEISQKMTARAMEESPAEVEPFLPNDVQTAVEPRRSFWGRLFGGKQVAPLVEAPPLAPSLDEDWRDQLAQDQQATTERLGQSAGRVQQMLTALLTGYTMGLQRVERALQQYELEPIPAVGQPFDPERMEVVEVVIELGRTTTEVIDEVRRGYVWQGRVFRFAQVRVARPEPV